MRPQLAVLALLLGFIVPPTPALATTTVDVHVVDNDFKPKRRDIMVGDSVHWLTPGETDYPHNVWGLLKYEPRTWGRRLFRSGDPDRSIDFTKTFSAGRFLYVANATLCMGGPACPSQSIRSPRCFLSEFAGLT